MKLARLLIYILRQYASKENGEKSEWTVGKTRSLTLAASPLRFSLKFMEYFVVLLAD
jgi:hypothetical protein